MLSRSFLVGIFVVGLGLAPTTVMAADATIVLTVHHANCVLCGTIVKGALDREPGVSAVEVSQADAMADVFATVHYDDAKTYPTALIAATTNQGYASEIKS